jgi:hypothetical protein
MHFAQRQSPAYDRGDWRRAVRIWNLGLAGILAACAWQPAWARQNPTPPPSGIVVHLFGQDSVMSNILPTGPARPAGPGEVAAAPGEVIYQGSGPQAGRVSGQAMESGYVEPSMGDVLHQMFVTGDPNDPVQNSTGRSKNRLAN